MACIEKVAEIVETARHDAKLIDELRVLSHKLAVVAGAGSCPASSRYWRACSPVLVTARSRTRTERA
jgi:hypothetical protein